MTYLWTKISGPGTVTFTTPTAASTHVDFSANGTYILRLTATGVLGPSFDDVTITVFPGCLAPIADPVLPDCS